jgi:acetoin utilization deacetylase AcuC-like enzyme
MRFSIGNTGKPSPLNRLSPAYIVNLYYSDYFTFPLPEGHRFPNPKYTLLRQRVLESGMFKPSELHIAEPAGMEQLLLVHTPEYVQKVLTGTLSNKEIRRIGLPWSPGLVERSKRFVGGTIAACRDAWENGIAANLAGGTHHAFADHGEGYCVFNDCAVATRQMQREGLVRRVIFIDLDVHQGNGSASLFAGDESVFTFSIHGEKNFPFHKEKSSLDIPLPDHVGDKSYLDAVESGTREALERSHPDLAIYLAGSDPFEGDRLGRLKISKEGLATRDRIVFSLCRQALIPVAVVMAGGYARNIQDSVDIHFQTLIIARDSFEKIANNERFFHDNL